MGKYAETQPEASKGPHRDFEVNLKQAKRFIENVQKLPGMSVYISNLHNGDPGILMVTFNPPRNAPIGNYAAPINMHQGSFDFNKQMESIYSAYYNMAKKFWEGWNLKNTPELPWDDYILPYVDHKLQKMGLR